MPTKILINGGGSGLHPLLIKTGATTGAFTKFYDISEYKKIFWSYDFTNSEDNCSIQVALIDANNKETNLFSGSVKGGQRYAVVDVGSNKRLKISKGSSRYSQVSFCCIATDNEILNITS